MLTRALAKDQAQRYQQPGAFANAYHGVLGSTNRTRLPFVVTETHAASNGMGSPSPYTTGNPISDGQFTDHSWSGTENLYTPGASSSNHSFVPSSIAATPISYPPRSFPGFKEDSLLVVDTPRPTLMRRFERRQRQRMMVIVLLIALVVVGSSAAGIALLTQKNGAPALSNARGQVSFFTNQVNNNGQTNALTITFEHLDAPPAGSQYEAWFINDHTEQVTDLGRLIEQHQAWALTYSNAQTNVLGLGDKFEITQEQGIVKAPTGKVIASATLPAQSFSHIEHLLVGLPLTPGKIGLLVGMLQQTHLLNIQAGALQSIANSRDPVAIGCAAQSLIDIIEGSHGAHFKPLTGTCTQKNVTVVGDGFGLLGKGYLKDSQAHASLALTLADSTPAMHQHTTLMDVALANVTTWITTIERDALQLQTQPTNLSAITEITTLADNAYHGVDANGNGSIEPIPGEAGAIMAYQQGQMMATLGFVGA